jgi:hypothetical protein
MKDEITNLWPSEQDAALLPRFILAFMLIGARVAGQGSLARWLSTPVLGFAGWKILVVVNIVSLIGGLAEYKKIRYMKHLSLLTRLTLVVAALAGVAMMMALPTTLNNITPDVGLWFIKLAVCIPLSLEGISLIVWKKSIIGLSIYYHYRDSINAGRFRINVLVLTQFFGFLGLMTMMGVVTYSYFAIAVLPGNAGIYLTMGMVLFIITAYITNFGIWIFLLAIASRWLMKSKGPNTNSS